MNADTEPIHKNALRNPFCRGRIPIYDNRKLPYFVFLFAETTAAPTTPTAAKLKTIPVSGLSSGSFSFVVSAISPRCQKYRYHYPIPEPDSLRLFHQRLWWVGVFLDVHLRYIIYRESQIELVLKQCVVYAGSYQNKNKRRQLLWGIPNFGSKLFAYSVAWTIRSSRLSKYWYRLATLQPQASAMAFTPTAVSQVIVYCRIITDGSHQRSSG